MLALAKSNHQQPNSAEMQKFRPILPSPQIKKNDLCKSFNFHVLYRHRNIIEFKHITP